MISIGDTFLFSIFFVKSSNIQVDSNIQDYKIKCLNCIAYNDTVFSFTNKFKINVSAIGYQSEVFSLSHEAGFSLVTLKPSKIKCLK